MSSNSFLVVSLRFSMNSNMSSGDSDSFTSLQSQVTFISFYSLIAVIKTSKIMLNISGMSGHLSLVPDPTGSVSSFSPLNICQLWICHSEIAQLCPTLCNPMGCSLPGSSVRGIFQARVLEWVSMSFSGDLPDPGIEPGSPALQADALPSEPPGKSKLCSTK